jgi:hypothetical protein
MPKRVVSVSLGSPSRDWTADLTPLGVDLVVERRAVGRDFARYGEMLAQLDHDPEVAAIGLGGINRYLFAAERPCPIRKAEEMASVVHHKPVTDGIGLKQHWEPHVVRRCVEDGVLPLEGRHVLMVCAADRWGMAAALHEQGAQVVYGDVMFGLGLPLPIRSWSALRSVARAVVPIAARWVPFEWLYPTGESKTTPKYRRWYDWADVLAGDWKFIAKHLPAEPGSLAGKTILTNTTTPADLEALRARGASLLITTTPSLGGRSFGTNAVEGIAVALAGKPPSAMKFSDYLAVFHRLGWDQPRVERLTGA